MGELEDRARTLRLFPEWGRGDLVSPTVPLSAGLRARLRAWNHTWETVLDPVSEIRWPDPEVGREWIAEGEALVVELRRELGPDVPVVAEFAVYSPDAPAEE
jgi:hypothetical protein